MPTFDIVNRVDIESFKNAIDGVNREVQNRYDFKGSNSTIELKKTDKKIKIEAGNTMQLEAIIDMLKNRSISRKVPIKVYDFQAEEKAEGMSVRQYVLLKDGISKENAKKINKLIKNYKLKVQSQIQGDQLRVTGKKIDDLQDVMQSLNSEKMDIALQYINLKK